MCEEESTYLKKLKLGNENFPKTANQIGLAYQPVYVEMIERKKAPRLAPLHECRKPVTHAGGYLTSYGVAYKDKGPAIESDKFTYQGAKIYTEIYKPGKMSDLNKTRRTEYGDEYQMKDVPKATPPVLMDKLAFCKMMATGRDEREAVDLRSNYTKHLDIYVSTSRMDFRPYNELEQKSLIAGKDIVTLYDTMQFPKGLGFGPKFPVFIGRELDKRDKPMVDKAIFKKEIKIRVLPKTVPRVPSSGMETEAQAQYTIPGGYARPHLFNAFTCFPTSIPAPSAKQGLSPPSMYLSEQDCIHRHHSPQAVV